MLTGKLYKTSLKSLFEISISKITDYTLLISHDYNTKDGFVYLYSKTSHLESHTYDLIDAIDLIE